MNGQMDNRGFMGWRGLFAGWFFQSWPRRLVERFTGEPRPRLLDLLALQGGETVLDTGCGSGYYSLALARHLPRGKVICVDLSPEMLTALERRARRLGLEARIVTRTGDCKALPVEDACADAAIAVAVWHHTGDPSRSARELARAIRPGGRAVVIDWHAAGGAKGHGHVHRGHEFPPFGPAELERCLTDAGLVAVRTEFAGKWVLGYGVKPA